MSMDDDRNDSGDSGTHEEVEQKDNETILMALDQISQTIDVMTSVVGRLRHYVEEQELTQDAPVKTSMGADRTLH
ncbi:MAG: hypothetical protein AAF098_05065 [Pseudomonadota bacterium]